MADFSASTSGFESKSIGSGAGAGAAVASRCELWVCVGRSGNVAAFKGGVIGLYVGRTGDEEREEVRGCCGCGCSREIEVMGSGTGMGVVDCKGLAGGLLLLEAGADGRFADSCCCDSFEAAASVLRGGPAIDGAIVWRMLIEMSRFGWRDKELK
ncbi:hypothetical protein RRF57_012586 [Xylaria bambusicola]|uniref:Uncharacterized protein n=1 Tax=Xylaria bambusicola TaxID=326684 RepID=A0AAN7V5S8_9PEZI